MKSSKTSSIPETNDTSDQIIEQAASSARSDLAKYVFDTKNRANFNKLFAAKSPVTLIHELNTIKITPDQFRQFQIFTENQNEYAELFDLPPTEWLDILIKEKINGEDLAALIGSTEMLEGAVSGILNLIEEKVSDPVKKVKIYFYLNHSADATDNEIKAFFEKVGFKDASIFPLHHILHNVREQSGDGTRPATEGILRIQPADAEVPDNKARLQAALRILHACVDNHYNKALIQLTPTARINLQIEQDAFLAKQLDRVTANKVNQELNGELSARNIPEEHLRHIPLTFDLPDSMGSLFNREVMTSTRPAFYISRAPHSSFMIIHELSSIPAAPREQKHATRPVTVTGNDPDLEEAQLQHVLDDVELQRAIQLSYDSTREPVSTRQPELKEHRSNHLRR